MSLPSRPDMFYGHDELVKSLISHLTGPETTRLGVLGAGGMGKTTVALEVLYDFHVVELFGGWRIFISCEAMVDANAVIGKLAELCGVPKTTPNLQPVVVAYLTNRPRTILVLDNLETIWLAGGAPVAAVEELLGTLAQIPSLWLMITCRGTILPQRVRWSNEKTAALEPFSLDAALRTFADKAGYELSATDKDPAEQLLKAVDRMPLAVSLLGQLARLGNSLPELIDRWNKEHSALLCTHNNGRDNNIELSIKVSIVMLRRADPSEESLQLLSLCSMLPDGMRPEIFEKLRPQFQRIERARDTLSAYALVSRGIDQTLSVLNPIRHFVLKHPDAQPKQHDALCSIYFGIADRLPKKMDEHYKQLAATAGPEIGNLSSLLLMLYPRKKPEVPKIGVAEGRARWLSLERIRSVSFRRSSIQLLWEGEDEKRLHRIFSAVVQFTRFAYWQQPTAKLVSELLPYLENYPKWKADCLWLLGDHQHIMGEYRAAIGSLTSAACLFLRVSDRSSAARCKRQAGAVYQVLGEHDNAEALLNEAQRMYKRSGHRLGVAKCGSDLGNLMCARKNYPAAVEYLEAAQRTFNSFGDRFSAAQCSESLGIAYSEQNDLDSAAAELRNARSVFIALGDQYQQAQSTRHLASVMRRKRDFVLAEQLFIEAAAFYKGIGGRHGLAGCARGLGSLRCDQGRWEEAAVQFRFAIELCEALGIHESVRECKAELQSVLSILEEI